MPTVVSVLLPGIGPRPLRPDPVRGEVLPIAAM